MNAQGKLDDSRKSLLEQVDGHAAAGVERLQWLTTQDVIVCPLCQERDGRQYTMEEVRDILSGEFCRPDATHGRCRCTLMPAAKLETAAGELRPAGGAQAVRRVSEPSGAGRQLFIVAVIAVVLALLWLAIR